MEIKSDAIDNEKGSGLIDDGDWLHSISFTYAMSKKMNLRLSYGRTLARPTFKEKSKSVHYEFFLGLIENGNPDLKYTKINNFDLRWECFNGPGKLFAASLYYKHFTDPIERVLWGNNNDITWENVSNAEVYGIELEVRQDLGWLSRKLENFKFDGNFTLTHSQIDIPEEEMISRLYFDSSASGTRQLQGQSPYLLNLGLTYSNFERTTIASVQYNVFGKRLSEVGRGGMPDVYEYPFPMLNATLKQKIWGGISLKLSAKNLLNSKVSKRIEYKGNEYTFREYPTGRSISVGLSYKF
jgi:outer membrane receptor protein involved in Fe transport